ncbi:hypothetical protein JMJ35_002350 [Cladonia borealis]|uniref:Uncharacterized protein n=1 Tax=Cladonia borealis TaxID=184061 RepID=A0AA39R7N5_9LECA|nr:hypothetical protein JMJ35_002350 [Cladonia borealis]
MNRKSALEILVTGGLVHFNFRDHIERGDTHMLKHDPNINGVIFMYDVNRSGSFTWLLMRYEEYLKEKHAIIAFVGNDKAEDAWPPTRQISSRYAQEVADHWDTGSFHINAEHKIDLLLPMLYLARKILKLHELALVKPLPTGHMLPLPAPPPPSTLLRPPTPDYSTLKTTNKTYPLIGLAERIRRGVAKGYIVA